MSCGADCVVSQRVAGVLDASRHVAMSTIASSPAPAVREGLRLEREPQHITFDDAAYA